LTRPQDLRTSNTHCPATRAGIDGGRMFDVAIGFRF
jgi:hypothetical protein